MKAELKQREYLFDNYKVLLIILVVIGHFIEPCYDQNPFLYELKWGIVAFHMPAFIFISGYFSKKVPSVRKLFSGLVIPYFVYEIFYYLLYTFILDKETELYFTRPKFTLWYLMALCVAADDACGKKDSVLSSVFTGGGIVDRSGRAWEFSFYPKNCIFLSVFPGR